MFSNRLIAFVVFGAAVCLVVALAPKITCAQPIDNATVIITAKSPNYVGQCPKTFGFKGRFNVKAFPLNGEYYYEKSDGFDSKHELFTVISPKTTVWNPLLTTWTINKSGSYWVKFHAISGNTHIVSQPVRFTVNCTN